MKNTYEELAILVQKAQKKNEEAFSELYIRTYPIALAKAKLYAKNDEQLAEDIAQEAFIKIYKKLDTLEDSMKYISWMNLIVTNTALDHLKKKNPVILESERQWMGEEDSAQVDLSVGEAEEAQDMNKIRQFQPEEHVDYEETKQIIWGFVENLPERQKIAVDLFYFQECPVSQVAKVLDCPEGTVKSLLYAARKNLRIQVEEEEKKGVRLHCNALMVIPFLMWMWKEQEAAVLTGSFASVGSAALQRSTLAKNNTALKTAAKTVEKSVIKKTAIHGAKSVLVKGIAGVAAAAMISGGIFAAVNNKPTFEVTPETVAETIQTIEQETEALRETEGQETTEAAETTEAPESTEVRVAPEDIVFEDVIVPYDEGYKNFTVTKTSHYHYEDESEDEAEGTGKSIIATDDNYGYTAFDHGDFVDESYYDFINKKEYNKGMNPAEGIPVSESGWVWFAQRDSFAVIDITQDALLSNWNVTHLRDLMTRNWTYVNEENGCYVYESLEGSSLMDITDEEKETNKFFGWQFDNLKFRIAIDPETNMLVTVEESGHFSQLYRDDTPTEVYYYTYHFTEVGTTVVEIPQELKDYMEEVKPLWDEYPKEYN